MAAMSPQTVRQVTAVVPANTVLVPVPCAAPRALIPTSPPVQLASAQTPSLASAQTPSFPVPPVDEAGAAEDAALLAALAKKCKTLDPSQAEIVDPANFVGPHVLRKSPKLTVVPHFLNDMEVDHLLQLAEPKWQKTQVMTAGPKGNMSQLKVRDSSLRTSSGAPLDYAATPIVAAIEQKVCELAGIDVNYLEKLVLVRYEDGQQYKIHHDGNWRPMTVFIYLNDLPEDAEGETFFPNLDLKVKPRKGCAVMWPNTCGKHADGQTLIEDTRVMHAGLPPKGSVKFGVNCFFNMAPKRIEREDGSAISGQGPPAALLGKAPAPMVAPKVTPKVALRTMSPTLSRQSVLVPQGAALPRALAPIVPVPSIAFPMPSVAGVRQVAPFPPMSPGNRMLQPVVVPQLVPNFRCGSPPKAMITSMPMILA